MFPSSAALAGISSTITATEQDDRRDRKPGVFRSAPDVNSSTADPLAANSRTSAYILIAECRYRCRGSRREAEQCLCEAVRQPTRDHHLLLIAAAEPTQFRFRTRVDPESGGPPPPPARARCAGVSAPISRRGETPGERRSRESIAVAAAPAIDSRGPAREAPPAMASAGMTKRQRLCTPAKISPLSRNGTHAGDAIEQFLLTLALQSRDAENFAPPQTERDVIDPMAAAQAARTSSAPGSRPSRCERRAGRGGVPSPRRWSSTVRASARRSAPRFRARYRSRRRRPRRGKHRRPVAERRDLGHSMQK